MNYCFHRHLATTGFLLLALGGLALQPFAHAQAETSAKGNVLFILDGSGSMWAQIDDKPKIVIAKDVMTNLIQQLPDTVDAGLEVYGHRSKGDCNDIELMSPVGKNDKATLVKQIQSIQPKGKTPITESLKFAAEQLKSTEEETTVVLISDGKESCEGDPCALVRELREQGIKVKVHVVGFDVDKDEREQLVCIAEAGGGKYFTAQNTNQLKDALTEVKEEVIHKAEAKPKEPETTTNQKVVKIKRPAVGTIEIKNTQDFVDILDQRTGEKKGFRGSRDQPIQVPAGTYKLKFPNFTMDSIVVEAGQNVVIE
jgi:Ca-activated chloride channel family protein